LNSKNNLNTTPSTLKAKETKETFMATRTLTMYNITKNEEILKELKEELQAVKKIRDDLSNKIESQKKINEKCDKEVSDLNNELSDKFSFIYQLETQLEKLKKKKKKKIAE
jgi:septal ring factor EnvC (AmiA/AmiB activator)